MLIVVDVWIVYWWCEGNMFADYRHDVCQVQKKILLFWAWKAELLQNVSLILTKLNRNYREDLEKILS